MDIYRFQNVGQRNYASVSAPKEPDIAVSTANANATLIYGAKSLQTDPSGGSAQFGSTFSESTTQNLQNVVSQIDYSYSGGTVTGRLFIVDGSGGNNIFDIDITATGPGQVKFQPPLKGTPGLQMQVVLAAGGTGVIGKLNVGHWYEGDK